jgi:hypothetical protein
MFRTKALRLQTSGHLLSLLIMAAALACGATAPPMIATTVPSASKSPPAATAATSAGETSPTATPAPTAAPAGVTSSKDTIRVVIP